MSAEVMRCHMVGSGERLGKLEKLLKADVVSGRADENEAQSELGSPSSGPSEGYEFVGAGDTLDGQGEGSPPETKEESDGKGGEGVRSTLSNRKGKSPIRNNGYSSASSNSSSSSGTSSVSRKASPNEEKPKVEVGDDFSSKYNAVLFLITCVPLAATVYQGYTGSKALGPWMVVSLFHFLYVGLTYRGAPEITGCREIQVVRRDGPVIRHIGETVRRYFDGSIIKECELDPKGNR